MCITPFLKISWANTSKAVQISDFFIVKKQAIDIPALYQPHGRYAYWHGVNWRALTAMVISVTPQLPGLANAVNPKLFIGGAVYISNLNWYYGFFSCALVYVALSKFMPAKESLVPMLIESPEQLVEGAEDLDEKRFEGDVKSKEVDES